MGWDCSSILNWIYPITFDHNIESVYFFRLSLFLSSLIAQEVISKKEEIVIKSWRVRSLQPASLGLIRLPDPNGL